MLSSAYGGEDLKKKSTREVALPDSSAAISGHANRRYSAQCSLLSASMEKLQKPLYSALIRVCIAPRPRAMYNVCAFPNIRMQKKDKKVEYHNKK